MSGRPVFRSFAANIRLHRMDNKEEKACSCALGRIFGFEPRIALALISHKGSAAEVFRTPVREIEDMLGPYSRYHGQITASAVRTAEKELEELEQTGIAFISHTEDSYPALLKECEDAPVGIYIRSGSPENELFPKRRFISIVGTRDISPYGTEWCENIVEALSGTRDKPVIVSGLALGTDICAHRTAVECGLSTIGVMATGPEQIYPSRHYSFGQKIAGTPGCALVTDYPPGTAPLAVHFLRRNRIIAGMSEATILIESKAKGGGMMTASLAFSYNRSVYALPGRIDDPRSQGCNILIRNNTAAPIVDLDKFASELGLRKIPSSGSEKNSVIDLSAMYGEGYSTDSIGMMSAILMNIRRKRGITIEELAECTGLRYQEVLKYTGILETDGLICTDLLQRCTINKSMK